MAYRDDRNALEIRRAALEEELSTLRARQRELDGLKGRQEELEKELAKMRALLESAGAKVKRSLLDNARVASPCSANWDAMVGDDRARFCGMCAKNVYNLSAMTRDEAEEFLRARTGDQCVRLYRRADGTVLTADCPVGVAKKRRRHLAVIAVGGGVLAASAWSALTAVRPQMGVMSHHEVEVGKMIQGEMAPPEK